MLIKTDKRHKFNMNRNQTRRRLLETTSAAAPRRAARPDRPPNDELPPLAVLQKKYDAFDKHYLIYKQGLTNYFYLGHMLRSADFRRTGARFSNQFDSVEGIESPEIRQYVAMVNAAEHGRYVKSTSSYIETIVDLPDITFKINTSTNEFHSESRKKAVAIVKAFFPEFKMPTDYKVVETPGKYNPEVNTKEVFVKFPDISADISFESFTKRTPKYEHDSSLDRKGRSVEWDGTEYPSMLKGYPRQFANIGSLRLELNQDSVTFNSSLPQNADVGSEGPLPDGVDITFFVQVKMVMHWPLEFAFYVTSCKTPRDFVPFLFYQYISYHRVAYGGMRNKKGNFTLDAPSRVNHLGVILDNIKNETKKGKPPVPKVNEDDLTIVGLAQPTMTGDVLWIPRDTNRVAEYVTQIKNTYNADNNQIEFHGFTMKGSGIFTDWHNEKFTFMRESGLGSSTDSADASGLLTYDLLGSIPLDFTTIDRDLQTYLTTDPNAVKNFASYLDKFANGSMPRAKPTKNYLSSEYYDQFASRVNLSTINSRTIYSVTEIVHWLMNTSGAGIKWGHLGGMTIEGYDNNGTTVEYEVEKVFCEVLSDIITDAFKQFDDLDIGYQARLALRYRFVLLTKYAKKATEYRQLSAAKTTANKIGSNEETELVRSEKYGDISKIVVPNLPGFTMMMPHQIETNNVLTSTPPACFIDVTMGGGKTTIGLLEALQLILNKKVKRALIIVPPMLVRSWVNEINSFSKGEVNPFALTLTSMRRMQDVLNVDSKSKSLDYTLMRKIIEACPPNTIFITSYNFIRAHIESVLYGSKEIDRYIVAEQLASIGFDAVYLDESHKAKNLGSAQTKAAAVLTSAAKIVRLMSGTLVNNTLLDLVGQAAMANPAAFGSSQKFTAKYGNGGAGNSTLWDTNAQEAMISDSYPYLKRITHKRQRWAFVLPKLSENFRPVQFTENQQAFYDKTLNNLLREFLSDPEFLKKIASATEKEQSAIIKKLSGDPAFQELEKFVQAPDSHEGFMATDIDDEDKVSPKVRMLEHLLDIHFNGDPAEGVPPQSSKVIVFGYRKETSDHIIRHLSPKYAKIAAHYKAETKFRGALDVFLKNDKIRILVADETSINTGQNFQLASRLIRMETLWTPGDQDQALARIWRPDFKGLAERPYVYMDWVFTDNSLEVAKIGRIVAKSVDKMRYDWQESPQFSKDAFIVPSQLRARLAHSIPNVNERMSIDAMLPKLTAISMNIDTLRNPSTRSANQIMNYFDTLSLISNWENMEFDRQRDQPWAKVSKVNDKQRQVIEGSRALRWVPRVEGVDPNTIDPDNHFGYIPLSIIQNSDSEDDDSEMENIVDFAEINEGDLVNTEFGFGYIERILTKDVHVSIPGLSNTVMVPKAATWLVTDPDAIKEVTRQIKAAGKKGVAILPEGITGTVVTDVRRAAEQEDKAVPVNTPKADPGARSGGIRDRIEKVERRNVLDQPDAADITDNNAEIEVFGEIIDGSIGLMCFADDSDSEILIDHFDFKPIAPYYAVKITRASAIAPLLDLLDRKFSIKPVLLENIEDYEDLMRNKKLAVHDPNMFRDSLLFFRISNHKQAERNEIRPFPIVWGGKLFIAVNKSTTPAANKFLQVCENSGINGVKMISNPLQESVHVLICKNKKEAIAKLKDMGDKIKIPNKAKTLAFLEGLKSISLRDEEPAPPARPPVIRAVPARPAARTPTPAPARNSRLPVIRRTR